MRELLGILRTADRPREAAVHLCPRQRVRAEPAANQNWHHQASREGASVPGHSGGMHVPPGVSFAEPAGEEGLLGGHAVPSETDGPAGTEGGCVAMNRAAESKAS